jgi:D-aspartate ligase
MATATPGRAALSASRGVKSRPYPPYAGATSLGRCQDNETLRGYAEQLLDTIGYRGIMDLDYRLDLRRASTSCSTSTRGLVLSSGSPKTTPASTWCALHLDLTGREVRRRPQNEGRAFMVEQSDLLASLRYHRAGDLSCARGCPRCRELA